MAFVTLTSRCTFQMVNLQIRTDSSCHLRESPPAWDDSDSGSRPQREGSVELGSILLRQLVPDDYAYLTSVIDEWWGGRAVRALLPRVFFEHFNETSFVLEDNKDRIAFLVGFISQSRPTIAYGDATQNRYGKLSWAALERSPHAHFQAASGPDSPHVYQGF